MNDKSELVQRKSRLRAKIESKINHWIQRTKALNGEPRYVAMGMAVGIFVSATPTIPFQTLIAVTLAFILRGSKAAAAIGVWLSNPITFPVFYLASYKTGAFLFGISDIPGIAGQTKSDLLKLGFDITLAAITGGIVIGIFLAIGAYFIARKIVTKIHSRDKRSRAPRIRGKGIMNRRQIPSAPHTAPNDPACEYSTAILCHPETKDQRPRT